VAKILKIYYHEFLRQHSININKKNTFASKLPTMEYNIYCDESCHLEHDGSSVMVLGR
jgi:hypothetical protein